MTAAEPTMGAGTQQPPIIFVVDDDEMIREQIRAVLVDAGHAVEDYAECEVFLEAFQPGREGCLVIDLYLPGMTGIELLEHLNASGNCPPSIMITGYPNVAIAVKAMKAGAFDFVQKPIGTLDLLARVERALAELRRSKQHSVLERDAVCRLNGLTPRQRRIMELLMAGHRSKAIAMTLGISERTVESDRASIMTKTDTRSLLELVHLGSAAGWLRLDASAQYPWSLPPVLANRLKPG